MSKKITGLLMNHAVGGILPAVSVFRESCYRHIVLYHCIVSYQVFVPVAHFFFPKVTLHILLLDVVS